MGWTGDSIPPERAYWSGYQQKPSQAALLPSALFRLLGKSLSSPTLVLGWFACRKVVKI